MFLKCSCTNWRKREWKGKIMDRWDEASADFLLFVNPFLFIRLSILFPAHCFNFSSISAVSHASIACLLKNVVLFLISKLHSDSFVSVLLSVNSVYFVLRLNYNFCLFICMFSFLRGLLQAVCVLVTRHRSLSICIFLSFQLLSITPPTNVPLFIYLSFPILSPTPPLPTNTPTHPLLTQQQRIEKENDEAILIHSNKSQSSPRACDRVLGIHTNLSLPTLFVDTVSPLGQASVASPWIESGVSIIRCLYHYKHKVMNEQVV